ncbi:MAG: hypothetical protein NC418_04755 [Muribaculaceae bacterium]|nr:hypothetical protein [Muribaculaceae bacterium]
MEKIEKKQIELSADELEYARNNSEFGVNLFQELCSQSPLDENISVSPLGVSLALTILSNNCDDESVGRVGKVVGFSNLEVANSYAQKLTYGLEDVDRTLALGCHSAVWFNSAYETNPAYIRTLENVFQADIYRESFALHSDDVNQQINQWIANKTKGSINEIDIKLTPIQYLAYVNALYFKGGWEAPFSKDETEKKDFNGFAGRSKVDMMHRCDDMYYVEGEMCKSVILDFGLSAFSARIILPNEGVDCTEVKKLITDADRRGAYYTVDLNMPAFTCAQHDSMNLSEVLKNMCLDISLLRMKDDVDMAGNTLFQKNYLKVTEDGADFSSVTFGDIATAPGTLPEMKYLDVNRPFIFLIQENSTKAVLFAGLIGIIN